MTDAPASVGPAARLRAEAAPLREACLRHPFVHGIGAGTLAPEVFARWVCQDWLYLQRYVEVLGRAARIAPTAEARARWSELRALTVDHELDLHRAFAARFGLSAEALDATAPYEATRAYGRFLAESASSYPLLVAAVVPCGVGYVEIARALAAQPAPADARYADWIRTYDDPVFREAVAWMEAELDGHGSSDGRVEETYHAGARHELAFWEALWAGGPAAG
ncbi:MAG: thiaminase II [Deltaproteobacteria bacterium]|nr:MAG: thiaminase II [Deltaproteobacteria bacterium]